MIQTIKANFEEKPTKPDDDINVSVDQTENLTTAIARGMHYPILDANGNVSYDDLMDFLEWMCRIFKWEKYERQTLGRVSKKTGKCCYNKKSAKKKEQKGGEGDKIERKGEKR